MKLKITYAIIYDYNAMSSKTNTNLDRMDSLVAMDNNCDRGGTSWRTKHQMNTKTQTNP